ncbi:hypothetical protein ACFZB9_14090 [Kitasatospora sp. NPDC008050]|uniref:hypothetical protein n=1 Tax=Kitasatospora sp. NPDC008050 TaxID=3364021 RepID=UPI0036ED074C
MLPTPTVSEATGIGHAAGGGIDPRHTISLLPIPVVADGERTSPTYGRGNPTLAGALLPTPRATDGSKGGPNQRGSKGDLTLPSAAARIGAPTGPRSSGGRRRSADPLPGQLTIEDA